MNFEILMKIVRLRVCHDLYNRVTDEKHLLGEDFIDDNAVNNIRHLFLFENEVFVS